MIHVRGLEKRHPGAAAATLKGLSFELPEGKLAAILGKSGSGKSTLLRCLVGLEPFDRGVVAVDGVEMGGVENSPERARVKAKAAIRSNVGLVFQSFELFPHLSILDNCLLAPVQVKRQKRGEAQDRVEGLLRQLGLADKAKAYPDHLSGGQRQRAAIARALAMEPRVLLYDEPTSALDPSLKNEVLQAIRRVQETGVTQVMVTHDIQLAKAAAEVVFVLDEGQIVEWGDAGRVFDAPEHSSTRRLLSA